MASTYPMKKFSQKSQQSQKASLRPDIKNGTKNYVSSNTNNAQKRSKNVPNTSWQNIQIPQKPSKISNILPIVEKKFRSKISMHHGPKRHEKVKLMPIQSERGQTSYRHRSAYSFFCLASSSEVVYILRSQQSGTFFFANFKRLFNQNSDNFREDVISYVS